MGETVRKEIECDQSWIARTSSGCYGENSRGLDLERVHEAK